MRGIIQWNWRNALLSSRFENVVDGFIYSHEILCSVQSAIDTDIASLATPHPT